jgi:hypothetical protein
MRGADVEDRPPCVRDDGDRVGQVVLEREPKEGLQDFALASSGLPHHRETDGRSLVGGIGDQAVGQEDKRQLLLVVKAEEVNRVED